MKRTIFLVFAFFISRAFTQTNQLDSLDDLISKSITDTGRINLEIKKAKLLLNINLDTSIALCLKTLDEIKKINYYRGEMSIRRNLASNYIYKGNYKAAEEQLIYLGHFIKPTKDSSDFADFYGTYGFFYSAQNKFDTSIHFYEKAINILERKGDTSSSSLTENYINLGIAYQQQSNFPMALQYYQKTLSIAEATKNEIDAAFAYVNMGIVYALLPDVPRAEKMYLQAAALGKKNDLTNVELYAYSNLASLYIDIKKWDQAYDFAMKAASLGEQMGEKGIQAASLSRAALAFAFTRRFDSATILSNKALILADASSQPLIIFQAYGDRGQILYMQKKYKDALPFYEKGLSQIGEADIYQSDYAFRYKELSECYEKNGNNTKALEAFKKYALVADSVRRKENVQKATELTMNYEFDKKQQVLKAEQLAKDRIASTNQKALIVGLGLTFALTIVAFVGFRNKQRSNTLLQQKTREIQNTLTKLKSTQAQLIQSEKMASLGELTAGIAHEIQNPLNFVNNFSEVSNELIDEMKDELSKGNYADAKEIADDVKQNLEKINHHGKRADAIVKGMLQHSKSSTGIKELTDINALCEEYTRLCYHGLRAADKSFNASIKTSLDPSLKKVDIVPQDIGRVILNLLNNAFYAVNEKKKNIQLTKGSEVSYEPTVTITTRSLKSPSGERAVEIKVTDNGGGIPQKILDKIFQPFFTTKPTGQGTGLGLSLSYDIVTKEHGGEIKVSTTNEEGSVFTIQLPLTA